MNEAFFRNAARLFGVGSCATAWSALGLGGGSLIGPFAAILLPNFATLNYLGGVFAPLLAGAALLGWLPCFRGRQLFDCLQEVERLFQDRTITKSERTRLRRRCLRRF